MNGHPTIAYMLALQMIDERRRSAETFRVRARATQPSAVPGTTRSTTKKETQ
jgi:hypothetical protein